LEKKAKSIFYPILGAWAHRLSTMAPGAASNDVPGLGAHKAAL